MHTNIRRYADLCEISGFRRCVDEVFAVGMQRQMVVFPTFRHSLSVPSSRVKQSSLTTSLLKIGSIDCPETPVYNHQHTLHNNPEERKPILIYTAWIIFRRK